MCLAACAGMIALDIDERHVAAYLVGETGAERCNLVVDVKEDCIQGPVSLLPDGQCIDPS